jgi:hypothetical protein
MLAFKKIYKKLDNCYKHNLLYYFYSEFSIFL